jgi:lysozyme
MLNPPMQPSNGGIHFTEHEEGTGNIDSDGNFQSYWDAIGKVWTIAYGLTGALLTVVPVVIGPGLTLTPAQVDAEMAARGAVLTANLNNVLDVEPTQGEFDAFWDFEWNLGDGAFTGSTMLKLWNAGDVAGCRDQFQRWDKAQGVVVAGLLNRRIAEQGEYDS